jgi:DNA-binding transcriptional LysR family regulator
MVIPHFSLRQLSYFVTVAETGSIRAASEAIHVSQTAISHALNELERELGCTLFARQRARGATITEAGQRLIGQARALINSARDFDSSAHEWSHGLTGRLAVGCFTTLCPVHIPGLFAEYQSRHPAVSLDLLEGSTEDIATWLRQGTCDIGLTYTYELGPDISRLTLYERTLHVLLSPTHPLVAKGEIDLREIASDPFILLDLEPAVSYATAAFEQAGVSPTIAYRTKNLELAMALAARGLGYTMLLRPTLTDVTPDGGRVETRPVARSKRRYPVALVWVTDRPLSRRANEFRALCGQVWPGTGTSEGASDRLASSDASRPLHGNRQRGKRQRGRRRRG